MSEDEGDEDEDLRAELRARASTVPPDARRRVAAAIAALELEGLEVTVRAARDRAKCSSDHASAVVSAWRAGVLEDLEGEGGDVAELLELLEQAESPRAVAKVAREVGKLVARGKLPAGAGKLLIDACREQRQGLAHADPDEEAQLLVPCTAEGGELLGIFEAIADDARRAAILEHVKRELEVDQETGPSCQAIAAPIERGPAADDA